MGSPLFKPGGQIVKAFDSMGSLEKWALPTRLSLTVGRDGHQVGNGTVNGMDSYGRIQIVKSPPGLDFKPVRTSTEPYGCIFKGWWRRGERQAVPPYSPLYIDKCAKSAQTNIKFHCAPAIGLDFYQVYFLCAGGKGSGQIVAKKKTRGAHVVNHQ